MRIDAKHFRALKQAPAVRSQKSLLLLAAAEPIPGGRQRSTAVTLALLLGLIGVHRFYLGERAYGMAYIMWSWTLVPWIVAIFEAINYWQMSRVTFNLTYNIEQVLSRLPPEEKTVDAHSEVFSMEPGEQPEDEPADDFSQPMPPAHEKTGTAVQAAVEETAAAPKCHPA